MKYFILFIKLNIKLTSEETLLTLRNPSISNDAHCDQIW
jgi:hypothetical protein